MVPSRVVKLGAVMERRVGAHRARMRVGMSSRWAGSGGSLKSLCGGTGVGGGCSGKTILGLVGELGKDVLFSVCSQGWKGDTLERGRPTILV